ncbi:AAA family ATPase, partial [bacterium]|nr:AAA family ATPase [bacterium]
LPFKTTAELEPNREIIGQDRAVAAITLGLAMKSPGYNIFLSGFVGTGRNTTIRHMLRKLDGKSDPPPDLCYVHNFETPDRPRALSMPAGYGRRLVKRMRDVVRHLEREVPKVFEDEPYRKRMERIATRFRKRQHSLIQAFEKELEADDFALMQVQAGGSMNPQVVPVFEGEPRFLGDLEEAVEEGKLEQKKFEQIREKARAHAHRLQDVVRDTLKLEHEMQTRFSDHDRQSVRPAVRSTLGFLSEEFTGQDGVREWLASVEEHIVENLDDFRLPTDADASGNDSRTIYEVNLVVDNAARKGAPIVVENVPGMGTLFGMIERHLTAEGDDGLDHTRIRAGALHQANGGYLVLNATDIFAESAAVWTALKRTLRTGKAEIPGSEVSGILGPAALKPEPVDITLKVLLVGDAHLYSLLHAYDDDFRKIFKVRADFDTEMPNTPENVVVYGQFVQRIVDEEGVRPFDRNAVAKVAEFGVREAGRRNRLTTRFNHIADLVREASYFADEEGKRRAGKPVTGADVDHALDAREHRNNLVMEKMQEMIQDNSVFIDVEGTGLGEVNGLAVFESGEHAFGLPSKITASVSLGNAGIINIEREAELSGRTHDKGVQILSGYLRNKYAQEKPLTLSASICFEQSYHGIDGDSASSTEVYAILSALAGLPLRQDIAVTGSVNQLGEIQPIGGANEKIEGFFDICRLRGLTGTQGVLIPHANLEDLMLHGTVVDAVRNGKFHIYTASTIDEGIQLLTGVEAGVRAGKRRFAAGTVNGQVERRLREMAALMRDFGGHS